MNNSYDLGPRLSEEYTGTLAHALDLNPSGTGVEFGVAQGRTLKMIADKMPVWGFDSFEGLPEKWREGFEKEMFACEVPDIKNATIVPGWFENTLPKMNWGSLGDIGLFHIDADLYSSTKTILKSIKNELSAGTLVCFDEWHGYPGCEEHEQLAWKEFVEDSDIEWEVIGHGPEQWLIRIL